MESGDSYIYGSNARKENNSRFHSPEEGNAGKDKDHLQNTELYGHEIRMDDESYTVEAAEKNPADPGCLFIQLKIIWHSLMNGVWK